jgi:predicted TIM-barrel enzyme
MHVLVRYRDEADTEFTGYAATIARDDAAMTDSGAERAARRIVRELVESVTDETFENHVDHVAVIIQEETGTHKHCELLSEARACLYMTKRHVTTITGSGIIMRCIDAIESDPHVIKYLDEAFAALPPAPEEGEKR